MNEKQRKQFGLIVSGGILGAVIGVIGAILLIKSSEEDPHLDSKHGIRLVLRVISILQSLIQSSTHK